MAIAYRAGPAGQGTTTGNATTTGTLNLPASWAAGDLLWITVLVGGTGQTISQTAGTGTWTKDYGGSFTSGGYSWAVFHRVMAGGDTGPTFGWATANVWNASAGGFYSDIGGALSVEAFGASDPYQSGSAATTANPNAATAGGADRASVIITGARRSANAATTSHTYTPSSGWTADSGGQFWYAGSSTRAARLTAIDYKMPVGSGSVDPGNESLTDSGSGTYWFTAVHALIAEAPPPVNAPAPAAAAVVPGAAVTVGAPAAAAAAAGAAPAPAAGPASPAVWSNTFESVTPSGTTLTQGAAGNTAGGGSYFDVVSIGSGATCVSDSAYAAHGTLSNKLATGATSAGVYVGWTTSIGSLAEFWFRICEQFAAAPAANYRFAQFGTGTAGIFLRYDTAGKIQVVSLADSSTLTITTAAVPTGQWIRLEGHVVMSTTTGSVQLKIWNSKDSAGAPDDDHTASGLNLGAASLSAYSFGLAGTSAANVAAWWQDDPAVSASGWIGPAGAGGSSVYPAAASAAGAAPVPSMFPLITGPAGWELGMGVSGAEWYTDPTGATSPTSNRSKGTYNSDYHYEGVDSTTASNRRSFDYLYSRGWRTVKIPVLWERLTDSPGSALNATQVTYLTNLLDRANDAGLKVTLDPHNYGNYYLDGADGGGGAGGVAGTGYRYPIACAPTGLPTGDTTVRVTQAHFADFWSRMTTQFLSHPAVTGVHLMNEPNPGGGLTQAAWYSAAQAAVNAIRAVDTGGQWTIRIGGWHWSDCYGWDGYNTSGLVVTDPAGSGKVWYEAHHYWWTPGSGGYGNYADTNTWAAANGYADPAPYADSLTAWVIDDLEKFSSWVHTNAPGAVVLIGEIGVPSTADTEFTLGDQAKWNAALDAYLTRCGQLGVHLDPWVAGETYGAGRLTIYSASGGRTTGLDTPRATAAPWQAATTGPRTAATIVNAPAVAASALAPVPAPGISLAPPAAASAAGATAASATGPAVTAAAATAGVTAPVTGITAAAPAPAAGAAAPATVPGMRPTVTAAAVTAAAPAPVVQTGSVTTVNAPAAAAAGAPAAPGTGIAPAAPVPAGTAAAPAAVPGIRPSAPAATAPAAATAPVVVTGTVAQPPAPAAAASAPAAVPGIAVAAPAAAAGATAVPVIRRAAPAAAAAAATAPAPLAGGVTTVTPAAAAAAGAAPSAHPALAIPAPTAAAAAAVTPAPEIDAVSAVVYATSRAGGGTMATRASGGPSVVARAAGAQVTARAGGGS